MNMHLSLLENRGQHAAAGSIDMTTANNSVRVKNNWYLVSSRGSVLFYIAVNPGCMIGEIAKDMALTPRTIWGLIGDLRRAHMLDVRRQGRRHYYTVNLNAEFKHPIIEGLTLRTVLGELIRHHARPEREGGRQREVTPD